MDRSPPIHGHSNGHYALVTQQPLRGRSNQGGNELKKWTFGLFMALVLFIFYKRCLRTKSDHIRARQEVPATKIIGVTIRKPKDDLKYF
ncbi:hypothetical protein Ddye_021543 [Dipteronia dyeriana]|uniref:DNA-directed RNA polymerase n=1 Tax=Dipteronia dyeriana TaxID=168575 RepID=A0AAD9U2A5_9ROSI|nr:hypothetical protein Ddye_021543 [Dipteronia dyeriana]